jgi:hypothetical protein
VFETVKESLRKYKSWPTQMFDLFKEAADAERSPPGRYNIVGTASVFVLTLICVAPGIASDVRSLFAHSAPIEWQLFIPLVLVIFACLGMLTYLERGRDAPPAKSQAPSALPPPSASLAPKAAKRGAAQQPVRRPSSASSRKKGRHRHGK